MLREGCADKAQDEGGVSPVKTLNGQCDGRESVCTIETPNIKGEVSENKSVFSKYQTCQTWTTSLFRKDLVQPTSGCTGAMSLKACKNDRRRQV